MGPLTIKLLEALKPRPERDAQQSGRSISAIIRELVNNEAAERSWRQQPVQSHQRPLPTAGGQPSPPGSTEPGPIRKILTHLGEPLKPPPISPPRGPPTDWGELVHVHDDHDIFQASPNELPAIDIHSL